MLPLTSWIIDENDSTTMVQQKKAVVLIFLLMLRFFIKGYIKKWGSKGHST